MTHCFDKLFKQITDYQYSIKDVSAIPSLKALPNKQIVFILYNENGKPIESPCSTEKKAMLHKLVHFNEKSGCVTIEPFTLTDDKVQRQITMSINCICAVNCFAVEKKRNDKNDKEDQPKEKLEEDKKKFHLGDLVPEQKRNPYKKDKKHHLDNQKYNHKEDGSTTKEDGTFSEKEKEAKPHWATQDFNHSATFFTKQKNNTNTDPDSENTVEAYEDTDFEESQKNEGILDAPGIIGMPKPTEKKEEPKQHDNEKNTLDKIDHSKPSIDKKEEPKQYDNEKYPLDRNDHSKPSIDKIEEPKQHDNEKKTFDKNDHSKPSEKKKEEKDCSKQKSDDLFRVRIYPIKNIKSIEIIDDDDKD